jgi:hypothetical protein
MMAIDVFTREEALQKANELARQYNLCETQRSRLFTTIRVFFFEKDPPTMEKNTFDNIVKRFKINSHKGNTYAVVQ